MNNVIHIGAWGFTMVISSFVFLYVGRKIDMLLNTEPNFMFGLMFLAMFMCIGKLFKEAMDKRNKI